MFTGEDGPPPTVDANVKEAYRRAVKLLHPDLAINERERQRRTELMALVNLAYERGDRATIEKLMKDFRQDPDAITGDDIGARLVKTIRRNAQLRQRLNEVQEEIEAEKRSESFVLRQRVEGAEAKGVDPLGDLAKQLIRQIAERKSELGAAAAEAAAGAIGRSMVMIIIALTLGVLALSINTGNAQNTSKGETGNRSERSTSFCQLLSPSVEALADLLVRLGCRSQAAVRT